MYSAIQQKQISHYFKIYQLNFLAFFSKVSKAQKPFILCKKNAKLNRVDKQTKIIKSILS